MWLSKGLTTTGRCGPTSDASWAEARAVNPAARTTPTIVVKGIAVKRIAPRKRIGFKLFIVRLYMVSTLINRSQRRRIEFARGKSWLEVEVKAHQQLAGVDIRAGHRRCSDLVENVELVMPGKARPTRHERVVAVAN